jgi:hypothetical protein
MKTFLVAAVYYGVILMGTVAAALSVALRLRW